MSTAEQRKTVRDEILKELGELKAKATAVGEHVDKVLIFSVTLIYNNAFKFEIKFK